mmetsp:Transcript_9582/g.28957  ORF Transcript_9582/g.28957 Transcript_9582/m.28957 type:complete len:283 (-) Transcript_9582:462-1310(-)
MATQRSASSTPSRPLLPGEASGSERGAETVRGLEPTARRQKLMSGSPPRTSAAAASMRKHTSSPSKSTGSYLFSRSGGRGSSQLPSWPSTNFWYGSEPGSNDELPVCGGRSWTVVKKSALRAAYACRLSSALIHASMPGNSLRTSMAFQYSADATIRSTNDAARTSMRHGSSPRMKPPAYFCTASSHRESSERKLSRIRPPPPPKNPKPPLNMYWNQLEKSVRSRRMNALNASILAGSSRGMSGVLSGNMSSSLIMMSSDSVMSSLSSKMIAGIAPDGTSRR